MKTYEKWSILALMRFLLAGIVALAHLQEYTSIGVFIVIPKFGAFEAVLGFLLISGFSIGESYKKKADGFYKRRISRIYPVYLACMIIGLFAYPITLSPGPILVLLLNLFFLNQLFTTYSFITPAWSLSLEVWLYALAPRLNTFKESTLVKIILGSLVCYTLYTMGRSLFGWNYYSGLKYGLNLPMLAYIWVAGFLLSKTSNKSKALNFIGMIFSYYIVLAAAIQVAFRIKNHTYEAIFPDLLTFVLPSICLLGIWSTIRHLLTTGSNNTKISKGMRFLGDISYPLYLVHIPIYDIMARHDLKNPAWMAFAAVLASTAVYYAVDFNSKKRSAKPAAESLIETA